MQILLKTADASTIKLSYAIGSITVGASETEYDSKTASNDQDVSSMNISYTVSEKYLSILWSR